MYGSVDDAMAVVSAVQGPLAVSSKGSRVVSWRPALLLLLVTRGACGWLNRESKSAARRFDWGRSFGVRWSEGVIADIVFALDCCRLARIKKVAIVRN